MTQFSRKRIKSAETSLSAQDDISNGYSESNNDVTIQNSPSSWKRFTVRVICIAVLIAALKFLIRWNSSGIEKLAGVYEDIFKKVTSIQCSKEYLDEAKKFTGCVPNHCARVVMDGLITKREVKALSHIAKKSMALGGSSGGASILDLHSGALSKDDKFVDIYKLIKNKKNKPFTNEDLELYIKVKNKILFNIAEQFEIPHTKLYLTKPTFFSRITTKPAKTIHDEYWHVHCDKKTYGSFYYTSLLYLSDYGRDFTGGRFIFIDKDTNKTIEPKRGRLSFFTSGAENLHHVEQLKSGTRYAITVAFTCDASQAIDDPKMR